MWLQFVGAAETVTGSRTIVHHGSKRILVDCGLFQGPKILRQLNWDCFPDYDKIDAVILTHAHVDHSGYLPKLVREGFSGPIYCSSGTRDLCKIMLLDSAHLQEEDAIYANRSRHSKHRPALPLYTTQDALHALQLFKVLDQNEWVELFPRISVRLQRSGHIIGSTFVELALADERRVHLLTFSGDVGNGRSLILKPPVRGLNCDYLVIESTYGDRLQPRTDPLAEIETVAKKVFARGGTLLIPAFTVGRTQELLYLFHRLVEEKRLGSIPIFVDSPMAAEATRIFIDHPEDHALHFHDGKLEPPLDGTNFRAVKDVEESKRINDLNGPLVIISAAGMLTGGRVLHHLKNRLVDPKNCVLFVGYQAAETKGRLLQEGIDKIRIHHEEIPVRAEVVTLSSLSAHADQQDLVDWVASLAHPPTHLFINHGEKQASEALALRLRNELHLKATVVRPGFQFKLN